MTVFEMIYFFQRKLETISDNFKIKERPDTDTILSYLNFAQEKYINEKYLSKGSFKENSDYLSMIAGDELRVLTQTTGAITLSSATNPGHPYSYYNTTALSSTAQYMHYIDSYTLRSATQPKTISEAWVINDAADSMQDLRNIETNAYNKPILRNPIVYLDGSINN